MPKTPRPQKTDIEEKKVIWLEFVAATAIFSIIALVIYMVFTYKPS